MVLHTFLITLFSDKNVRKCLFGKFRPIMESYSKRAFLGRDNYAETILEIDPKNKPHIIWS